MPPKNTFLRRTIWAFRLRLDGCRGYRGGLGDLRQEVERGVGIDRGDSTGRDEPAGADDAEAELVAGRGGAVQVPLVRGLRRGLVGAEVALG